jgi:hypothetical protein
MGYRGAAVGLKECNEGEVVKFSDHLADKAAAVEKEQDKTAKIMLMLESLTPGGSEYYNDPERCVAYVRDAIHRALKQAVETKKQEKAAVAQAVQEERERCRRQEVEPLVTICEEQAAAYRAERDGIDKVIAAVRSIQAQSPATPEKPTIQETFDKIREIVGDVYETESEQQAGKEQQ